jgi:hypothetical protein
MRQIDTGVDGQTVHEVRNTLAKLVGIRSDARDAGWNLALVQRDAACEQHIRMIIRRSSHRVREFCEQSTDLARATWTASAN